MRAVDCFGSQKLRAVDWHGTHVLRPADVMGRLMLRVVVMSIEILGPAD